MTNAVKAIVDRLRRMDPPPENDAAAQNDRLPPAGLVARLHVDPVTGDVQKVDFDVDPHAAAAHRKGTSAYPSFSHVSPKGRIESDDVRREMFRDMVYVRDKHWQIPDVVGQMQDWNGDEGLFFLREFEDVLMTGVVQDDADFGGVGHFDEDYDEFDDEFDGDDDDDGLDGGGF